MTIMRATNGLIYDRPAYVILPDGQQYKISFNREPMIGETINLDGVNYTVNDVHWIEELGKDPGSLPDTGIFTAQITVEINEE